MFLFILYHGICSKVFPLSMLATEDVQDKTLTAETSSAIHIYELRQTKIVFQEECVVQGYFLSFDVFKMCRL